MKLYKYIILLLLLNLIFSEKNSHEIQKEIDVTNQNLQEIKEEISKVENEIAKIKKEEKNNEKIIQTINKKINLIEKQIEQLLIQEKNINNLINVINNNIESEEKNLKNLKSQLEHRAKYLYKNGIIVRKLDSYGLKDCLRITIGKKQEMKKVIKVLENKN